jgi:hypothetical protein
MLYAHVCVCVCQPIVSFEPINRFSPNVYEYSTVMPERRYIFISQNDNKNVTNART